jgi:hypothetical protein
MSAIDDFQKHKQRVNTHGTPEADIMHALEQISAAWRHGKTVETGQLLVKAGIMVLKFHSLELEEQKNAD